MRIRFWGTRGSIATPGPGTVRYGGNTACIEVRSDAGALAVLDCGTGARELGIALAAEAKEAGTPSRGSLLIGHTHWDHIQGLPFFTPLFAPGNAWQVYGPRGLGQSLAQTLAGQMQYVYFPVAVDQLGADVTFHDLVEGELDIDDLHVTAQYLNHPALTLGYRIEADDGVLVYASDHEPHDPDLAHGGDLLASPADARHVAFLQGADVVVHDTQYLGAEFAAKTGWGHSTVEYVVDAARLADVGTLVLFHHDPTRDDAAVDALLAMARARAERSGYLGRIIAAAEGSELEVVRRPAVPARAQDGRSATFTPRAEDLTASVLVAARDPELRELIETAAQAEELRLTDGSDEAEPGVLVIDHDESAGPTDAVRRLVEGSLAAGRAVIGLTRTRPPVDASVTDWLVWPASLGHVRTKLRAAVLRKACRWQSAPHPADEEQRVASLHALGVLDTAAEERFDQYTRKACESLQMPMAMVSLVDSERQWFKSRQGTATTETPRDESVCAHVILGPDLLEIADLSADERFADSPATDTVRFYAGVPLVLSDGSRVGSFCVADDKPRVLDDDQRAELRALAALVQAELEKSTAAG